MKTLVIILISKLLYSVFPKYNNLRKCQINKEFNADTNCTGFNFFPPENNKATFKKFTVYMIKTCYNDKFC